ncbi:MAG: MFS transporter [Dehalococcoidia bacterium]|nr:MFS transporter [Dehalococcoidia bacterium]
MAAEQPTPAPETAPLAPVATLGKPALRARHWLFDLPTFSAFQYSSFRYLWAGSFFSSAALWVQQISLNWLIYDLTGSAAMLGLVNGVRTIPLALSAPFAGVMADRVDRKQLMLVTQAFLAVVAVVFAVDVALDYVQVWHVFVFAFLTGAGTGVNFPLRTTVIANVVPRKDLVNAVALGSVAMNITRSIGPMVGGFMIRLVSLAANFFLQAGCYVATFLTVLKVHLQENEDQARRAAQAREPFLTTMREGFRYMLDHKDVLALVILGMVPMLFIFPLTTLLPIFAEEVFDMGATGYGILLSAIGVGSVIGTLALATVGNMKRKALVFYASLVIAIAMSIAFAWIGNLALALVILGVQGCFQMLYLSLNNATLQLMVPDAVRGRVMSINMLNIAFISLGGLVGGLLAEAVDADWSLTVVGIVGLIFVALAFFLLPTIRKL